MSSFVALHSTVFCVAISYVSKIWAVEVPLGGEVRSTDHYNASHCHGMSPCQIQYF